MYSYIDINPEISQAIQEKKPVVALESTIISHGMPYPQNVETAKNVENIVREQGAVPATIGIIKGRIKVGLTEDELEFTELDINYLDVNFLEDLLDIIEDVNELDQTSTILKTDIDLKGTKIGYDSETQINTFMTDNVITFYKALEDTIKLDLDKTNAYTVVMIQNGKSTQIVVNGGGNSSITITQGD